MKREKLKNGLKHRKNSFLVILFIFLFDLIFIYLHKYIFKNLSLNEFHLFRIGNLLNLALFLAPALGLIILYFNPKTEVSFWEISVPKFCIAVRKPLIKSGSVLISFIFASFAASVWISAPRNHFTRKANIGSRFPGVKQFHCKVSRSKNLKKSSKIDLFFACRRFNLAVDNRK